MQIAQMERRKTSVWLEEDGSATEKRPWFGNPPELPSNDFSFVVMGDRCGMATAGVFEKGLALLGELKPDFALAVGDLIEGYWRDPAEAHAEWDEIDDAIAATNVPFFLTVGNHDVGNAIMADVWRQRKGIGYYAFRVGDILFLTLNTEHTPDELPDPFIDIVKKVTKDFQRDPGNAKVHLQAFRELTSLMSGDELRKLGRITLNLGEEQLAFAERVLKENEDAAWTFVTMHKPGWKSDSAEYRRLEEMLRGRPHTIFAGHLHSLEYAKEGDKELIQLGRTGGLAHGDGGGAADENLMLWVAMRKGVPSYRVIHLDGLTEIAAYPPQLQQHAYEEGA